MRIVVLAAVIGIAAAGLAYAVSPEVRHAVGHAAHAVKHSVGNFFDNDERRRRDDRAKRSHADARRGARGAAAKGAGKGTGGRGEGGAKGRGAQQPATGGAVALGTRRRSSAGRALHS